MAILRQPREPTALRGLRPADIWTHLAALSAACAATDFSRSMDAADGVDGEPVFGVIGVIGDPGGGARAAVSAAIREASTPGSGRWLVRDASTPGGWLVRGCLDAWGLVGKGMPRHLGQEVGW